MRPDVSGSLNVDFQIVGIFFSELLREHSHLLPVPCWAVCERNLPVFALEEIQPLV